MLRPHVGVGDPNHDGRVALSDVFIRDHRCLLQIMSARSHLQTAVLRSVARSFYLSIRSLPAPLRQPITLAYLLARTCDMVAHTSQIALPVRMGTLKLLCDGIQGTVSRDVVAERIATFVSLQENVTERQLLTAVSDCLFWLNQMEHANRKDIRIVLEQITRGQMLDLERFGD